MSILAFSGAQWILLLAFVIPVVALWLYVLVNLLGRRDLTVGVKLLWVLAVILLPLLGSLVYILVRPSPDEQDRRAQARHARAHAHGSSGRRR